MKLVKGEYFLELVGTNRKQLPATLVKPKTSKYDWNWRIGPDCPEFLFQAFLSVTGLAIPMSQQKNPLLTHDSVQILELGGKWRT